MPTEFRRPVRTIGRPRVVGTLALAAGLALGGTALAAGTPSDQVVLAALALAIAVVAVRVAAS